MFIAVGVILSFLSLLITIIFWNFSGRWGRQPKPTKDIGNSLGKESETLLRLLVDATASPAPSSSSSGDRWRPILEEIDSIIDGAQHRELKEKFIKMKLDALEAKCQNLRDENERLARTLRFAEATRIDIEESRSKRQGERITDSEIETLRAVFDSFDSTKSGIIRLNDFIGLHQKLGEPITEDEAKEALHEIDTSGTGVVTFHSFLQWWVEEHKGGKHRKDYSKRFKLLNAKLQVKEFDIARVQTTTGNKLGSRQFRVHFSYRQTGGLSKEISPWHDIPLFHFGEGQDAHFFHFLCEVPKWTRAKYEIATSEPFNPIKQDVKNGKLRFYKHGDMMFNYGCFPQTWEDPEHIDEETLHKGDNDPIDVLEIGTRQRRLGEVTVVKILGVLGLIDDSETDWKVLAISIDDPLAHEMSDVEDIDRVMPGALDSMREYFRTYKVWDGSAENTFAFNERAMGKKFATRIVEECHMFWKKLRDGNIRIV